MFSLSLSVTDPLRAHRAGGGAGHLPAGVPVPALRAQGLRIPLQPSLPPPPAAPSALGRPPQLSPSLPSPARHS